MYLDFNAIIHPCCNKTLENMYLVETQLYSNLNTYLDILMDTVTPNKMVFIAVDGVCPQAKLNQQRGRRFVTAMETSKLERKYFDDERQEKPSAVYGTSTSNNKNSKINSTETNTSNSICSYEFNTCSITPGTKFMERLDEYIEDLIRFKMSTSAAWRKVNVIYSSYRVPGEGEHKIMEYLRKYQKTTDTHMIMSPDADLIFLGMTLPNHDLCILREEFEKRNEQEEAPQVDEVKITDYSSREFVVLDLNLLRKRLLSEFCGVVRHKVDVIRMIEDWVFLCFTVGNDFLPTAPCFEIRSSAIDKITSVYLKILGSGREYITNHGEINFPVLRRFFAECAEREDSYIVEKSRSLLVARTRMNLTYDKEAEFQLNTVQGKIKFYREKMGVCSSEDLLKACKHYITGIAWIYKYYFYALPSWDWFYPYHFAPFMCDLACIDGMSVSFDLGTPLRAIEQLLVVVPSLAQNLLPPPMRAIYTEYSEAYPDTFKLDQFYKCMDWQAVPIIPFVDISCIKQFYCKYQHLLTLEEVERNVVATTLFFTADPQIVSKALNLYNGAKTREVINTPQFSGKIYPALSSAIPEDTIDRFGLVFVNKTIKFIVEL